MMFLKSKITIEILKHINKIEILKQKMNSGTKKIVNTSKYKNIPSAVGQIPTY